MMIVPDVLRENMDSWSYYTQRKDGTGKRGIFQSDSGY